VHPAHSLNPMDVAHLDIAHLVQSAIAPVFLLSGVAATLGVLTNRLARAVDRARALEAKADAQTADHDEETRQINDELGVLARRAGYINAAISMCGVSALLVALVVVTLFANAFFDANLASTIALLFVGSMLCLTGAFIAFLIEVRLATRALRIGIRKHQGQTDPERRHGRGRSATI
jgi:hypothetical protein